MYGQATAQKIYIPANDLNQHKLENKSGSPKFHPQTYFGISKIREQLTVDEGHSLIGRIFFISYVREWFDLHGWHPNFDEMNTNIKSTLSMNQKAYILKKFPLCTADFAKLKFCWGFLYFINICF